MATMAHFVRTLCFFASNNEIATDRHSCFQYDETIMYHAAFAKDNLRSKATIAEIRLFQKRNTGTITQRPLIPHMIPADSFQTEREGDGNTEGSSMSMEADPEIDLKYLGTDIGGTIHWIGSFMPKFVGELARLSSI